MTRIKYLFYFIRLDRYFPIFTVQILLKREPGTEYQIQLLFDRKWITLDAVISGSIVQSIPRNSMVKFLKFKALKI
jgi:hypothetical protein